MRSKNKFFFFPTPKKKVVNYDLTDQSPFYALYNIKNKGVLIKNVNNNINLHTNDPLTQVAQQPLYIIGQYMFYVKLLSIRKKKKLVSFQPIKKMHSRRCKEAEGISKMHTNHLRCVRKLGQIKCTHTYTHIIAYE